MERRAKNRIPLRALAEGLGVDYWALYRWCNSGLVRAHFRKARKNQLITVSLSAAIEAAAIVRLRHEGVPLQRLRKAAAVLRSREVNGARWLALTSFGKDVLIRDADQLAGIVDGQGFLTLLDLDAIRAEVHKIIEQRREAATA